LTFGDDKPVYNERELVMEDGTRKGLFDDVLEADIDVIAPEGQSLEGRIFRRTATKIGTSEFEGQENVNGQILVQGWEVKIPGPVSARSGNLYAIDATHVACIASMRLEFGRQKGWTLPGKVHLCVPGGQKGLFDAFLKDPIEVVGSFTATVK
jgi:hypothetical protein